MKVGIIGLPNSGKTTIFIANDGNYFDLVTDSSGKSSLKKLSSFAEIPTFLDMNLRSRQYIAETVRQASEINTKLGYGQLFKGATFKDEQGNLYIITPQRGENRPGLRPSAPQLFSKQLHAPLECILLTK